jgi:hypothetical protein
MFTVHCPAIMPKKRVAAANSEISDGEDMYNLPIITQPQQEESPLLVSSDSKKKKKKRSTPLPLASEVESSRIAPAQEDAECSSEENHSDDDLAPAAESISAEKSNVHDKR